MKRYLRRKKLFSVSFIAALLAYSGVNLAYANSSVQEAAGKSSDPKTIEDAVNEQILGKSNFIEGFSFVQKLLGKYEFNNYKYVKDLNGFIHYSGFYKTTDPNVFDYALRVKRLNDYCQQKGKKLLFCMSPSKYQPGYVEFPAGTPYNDPTFITEQLLFYLKRFDIEVLNLDAEFPNEDLSYEECFFRTDHHWTISAAYRSAQMVKEKIEELLETDLDPEGIYLDDDSYTAKVYPNRMLGSMGRGVGLQYTEIDDFTAYFPAFDADGLRYRREKKRSNSKHETKEGSYSDVILDMDAVEYEDDLYNASSSYSLYLDEITDWEKLENLSRPDGPKALMIRDSYFGPVMAFLSPLFSEIESIWNLTEEFSIDQVIQESEADVIIFELYPFNINDDGFDFFREPTEEELKRMEEMQEMEKSGDQENPGTDPKMEAGYE